ncbi:MAG: hypothetical protein M1822_005859 [Bathelium mastoideum]|nr:MAG: hypothetical protein M1822_005859 [Bathelium mastoideum]
MGSSDKAEPDHGQISFQEEEVTENSFLYPNRRRKNLRNWSRCFVYDSESEKVDVRPTEEVKENGKYQEIPLRRRQKHVILFVNENPKEKENGKILKTEDETKDDQHPVFFAKLELRGPGFWNKFLLNFGWLSTLYVCGNIERGTAGYAISVTSSLDNRDHGETASSLSNTVGRRSTQM